jgi:1-deoxy-D-xylulose-5-phosphate reductoisomerase
VNIPKQRITVLGSTGSVGVNTLDVISRHAERFEVFALSASTKVDELLAQCARFSPRFAVMASAPHAALLAEKIKQNNLATQVLSGSDAIERIASHEEVDAVMAAIVGAAGLAPCLAAARAGKRLLLANKEALVVGGELFMRTVREGGATLLPIDSEHSAIFQSLPEDPSTWSRRIDKIILTASGGPFLTRAPGTLGTVTPEQACAHPNWVMGRKISVDSATMMNKALEVIEARHLFGVLPEQIEVVIHPQSVVHSMVQFTDASVIAQLGTRHARAHRRRPGLARAHRKRGGAPRLSPDGIADLRCPRCGAVPGIGFGLACAARGTGDHGGAQCRQRGRGRGLSGPAPALRSHSCGQYGNFGGRCALQAGSLADLLALDASARAAANAAALRFRGLIRQTTEDPDAHCHRLCGCLGVLIAVHEYGHYRVAVACGVKVLRFSVGFGKTLFRWQPKRQHPGQSTEFVIGAFPLGGYVKMLDEREGPVAPEERHRAFNTQPLRSRAAIVAAGPIANLLLAVVLYTAVNWIGVDEPVAKLAPPGGGLARGSRGSARRRARHACRFRRRVGARAIV